MFQLLSPEAPIVCFCNSEKENIINIKKEKLKNSSLANNQYMWTIIYFGESNFSAQSESLYFQYLPMIQKRR